MKTIRLLMILCCTAWLASCSDDDSLLSEEPQTGLQIKFEMNFAGENDSKLKVSTATNFTSSWQNGDKIGVYIVKGGGALLASGNYADNVEFTYNGGAWTTTSPQYYPNDGDNLNFYAYYPYDVGMSNPNAYTFNVPIDQYYNYGENYKKNDFLWARLENTAKSDNAIQLQFSHALAMIEMNIFIDHNGTLNVNLFEAITSCTINLANHGITPGNTKNTIKMWYREAYMSYPAKQFYWALIPPQTMDIRFVWTNYSTPYTASPAKNVTLTSGNVKRYNTIQP